MGGDGDLVCFPLFWEAARGDSRSAKKNDRPLGDVSSTYVSHFLRRTGLVNPTRVRPVQLSSGTIV
jgi:hypothetical protein